jgi:RNase P/RNase MRP subunit p30
MRQYVDLHLKPSTSEQAQEMVSVAHKIGYSQIASTKPPQVSINNILVATRVDIEAKRGKELLDGLNRNRWRFDIIAVRCFSKEVARQAAKDDRVDILLFPDDPTQRKHNWLDPHEAELIDGTERAYEVNASDLLATNPTHLAKVINQLKRDLAVATKHDIPIVFSSGATTPTAIREPKALTALASLLDIDEDYAIEMISTTPKAIIEKNRAKLKEEDHDAC